MLLEQLCDKTLDQVFKAPSNCGLASENGEQPKRPDGAAHFLMPFDTLQHYTLAELAISHLSP
jgi:hypothetical protein